MKRRLAILSQVFLLCALFTNAWGSDNYKRCVEYFEDKDFKKAYRFCKESQDENAQFLMGEMYFNGLGVKENHVEAATWFRKAAEQGNCEALFRIGYMYYNGFGVKENHEEALLWFVKAAKKGHPRGRLYRDQILHKDKGK